MLKGCSACYLSCLLFFLILMNRPTDQKSVCQFQDDKWDASSSRWIPALEIIRRSCYFSPIWCRLHFILQKHWPCGLTPSVVVYISSIFTELPLVSPEEPPVFAEIVEQVKVGGWLLLVAQRIKSWCLCGGRNSGRRWAQAIRWFGEVILKR